MALQPAPGLARSPDGTAIQPRVYALVIVVEAIVVVALIWLGVHFA